MKFLFSLLALLLTAKECDQKKSAKDTIKLEIVNNEEAARLQQEECTIEYTAMSRGFYKEITVNSSTIATKNSRGSEAVSQECNKELWGEILAKLESFDVENLSKLEAPSQKRFVDGAAIGKLRIIYKDTTYQSSEFDHGYPPKEIELLCNKILEISSDKKQ